MCVKVLGTYIQDESITNNLIELLQYFMGKS